MTGDPIAPLVVTLALPEQDSAYFERLRLQFFPSHLNRVPAHLSLFHRLPGSEVQFVSDEIRKRCVGYPPPSIRFTGLRNLGQGVAFTAESAELSRFHAGLSRAFEHWLTPQDRQKLQPHVTVQNKVASQESKRTLALLQAQFAAWDTRAAGVSIWRYLDGPWELVETVRFGANEKSAPIS